jgi:hypothetical protein
MTTFVMFIQVMQHGHHLKGKTGDLFCLPRQQAADGNMPGGQEPPEDRNALPLGLGSSLGISHFLSVP